MSGYPVRSLCAASLLCISACAASDALPPQSSFGAQPTLPAPRAQFIPTVKIAPASSWAQGEAPTPAAGLAVNAFASGLDHPRWLYVLPNGDVLVAETNGPGEPVRGIRGWFMKQVMKRAGAGVESANRITLLRDSDGDGVAETRTVFLQGLHSPFGMALVGGDLYVANTDAVVRYPYTTGATEISAPGVKLTDLPAGEINHHWTKNIIASRDGTKLHATVGSNSNVGENGMALEEGRAAIWEIDRASGAKRLFATGLRNPNGMAFEPVTGVLWTVANERDEIGDDLVPDYLTSVRDGAFYGWPYSYFGQNVDVRAKPQRPDLVARAVSPDYALGAHTASLGLVFNESTTLPAPYRGGAFIGQHGSWNRSSHVGYKVIFVPFAQGRPAGPPQDVLTDFLDTEGHARGRPVGVVIDTRGALLVADDVGNVIWRVAARP
ncbi:MAG: sorbosone dehydrogenase family protein [Alphaproteobacteria bacterium]|nr:sorbosone dehydrogenase family protein [Alphaproteobacteria bacterium]